MGSFSALQAALVVAGVGSVLAASLPAFLDNLHASRLVEPVNGLKRIGSRANALPAGRAAEVAYPESVPLTPQIVPEGEPVSDPEGTWDHPTWRELDFKFDTPHSYSFGFESRNAPGYASFRAWSYGDLDGDGLYGTFQIWGESRDGQTPVLYPMDMYREVE